MFESVIMFETIAFVAIVILGKEDRMNLLGVSDVKRLNRSGPKVGHGWFLTLTYQAVS